MRLDDSQIDQVIETLETATEENRVSSMRAGQVVHLPAEGEVWVTGDLHDHRRNFEKFVHGADLGRNPRRHIVLHEIIHGEHFDENRAEDSWRMLVAAAELKCDYSGQVHFLFANHDLAQIHGEGIMKAGQSVCESFNRGVKRDFGDRRSAAHAAITEFLLSLPLAIRSPSGLFISHSIPGDEQIPTFDYSVFDRELTGDDYRRRTGPVYQLIWGRKMSPESAAEFADRVGARILINGHQPQESGYAVNGDRQIIIASDHNQGVFVPLSLEKEYDIDGVAARVRKFVSLSDAEPAARDDEPIARDWPAATGGAPEPFRPAEIEPAPAPPAADSAPPAPSGMAPPIVAPFPDDARRRELCLLCADAFADIRTLCFQGRTAQASELADAFAHLSASLYDPATWDGPGLHRRLADHHAKYAHDGAAEQDYAARFERIVAAGI